MTAAETLATAASEHTLVPKMLLLLFLLTISMCAGILIHKKHLVYFPETTATILVGIFFGLLFQLLPNNNDRVIQLESDFFMVVLLPPIMFEAGYSMKRVNFFKNFHTIMALAFIGTAFSAFCTGFLLWAGSQLLSFKLSFLEALTFGSLISATDPVSVLAALNEFPVDKNTYILVFGESALNDAVAIILFRFMTTFASPDVDVTAASVILGILATAGLFVGSSVIGLIVGMIYAKLTKHASMQKESFVNVEVALLIVFSYSSYLLCELLHLSGIVGIFFCGVSMAHYAYDNLSDDAQISSRGLVKVLAYVSETCIFVYLGLGLMAFEESYSLYIPSLIAVAIIAVLFSRVHVFIISAVANKFRNPVRRITKATQTFLWFAGLRGALCFILALQLFDNPYFRPEFQRAILATTLSVILFTLIVMGSFTPVVLKRLKLSKALMDPAERAEMPQESPSLSESMERSETFEDIEIVPTRMSRISRLKNFDKQFLKPFLCIPKQGDKFKDIDLSPLQFPPRKSVQIAPSLDQVIIHSTFDADSE